MFVVFVVFVVLDAFVALATVAFVVLADPSNENGDDGVGDGVGATNQDNCRVLTTVPFRNRTVPLPQDASWPTHGG